MQNCAWRPSGIFGIDEHLQAAYNAHRGSQVWAENLKAAEGFQVIEIGKDTCCLWSLLGVPSWASVLGRFVGAALPVEWATTEIKGFRSREGIVLFGLVSGLPYAASITLPTVN
jgi:hypothetical protein